MDTALMFVCITLFRAIGLVLFKLAVYFETVCISWHAETQQVT
jgi:ABC-type nitrate/sulfonate/bicarbonate transport system permease component